MSAAPRCRVCHHAPAWGALFREPICRACYAWAVSLLTTQDPNWRWGQAAPEARA